MAEFQQKSDLRVENHSGVRMCSRSFLWPTVILVMSKHNFQAAIPDRGPLSETWEDNFYGFPDIFSGAYGFLVGDKLHGEGALRWWNPVSPRWR